MNDYVIAGYAAAGGILGVYAVYVRRRARVLSRLLGDDRKRATRKEASPS